MKTVLSTFVLFILSALLATPLTPLHAEETSNQGFQRRGFYLHGSWVMNHPFAVRSWEHQDFAGMFKMLQHLGYNTVMWWPTLEVAPMPLSDEDAQSLRKFRNIIDAAHEAGLECWVASCPLLVVGEDIRSQPWSERSLYDSMKTIRLDDPQKAAAYLKHRSKVLEILDNADAFVLIDGDPGGYPGAPVEEYLRILKSDQQTLPGKPIIPWIWNGWGRDNTQGGFWKQPVTPHVEATLKALKSEMSGEWELLPGRSHRKGWANGRTNIELTDQAGLMSRSTIMAYEVIEFEPTPPASVLQFDLIRNVLKEESQFADTARGVFGNAQQPIMVLPNLYYFARGAKNLAYLERSEREVLTDLAGELGGDAEVLVPAWSCLKLSLADLPADLASRVRTQKFDTDFARSIPGGPVRYAEILAAQVESRRGLLEATEKPPASATEAAASLADGASALISWWQVHQYIKGGNSGDPFQWQFVQSSELKILREHSQKCVVFGPEVVAEAARILSERNLLTLDEAKIRLQQLR